MSAEGLSYLEGLIERTEDGPAKAALIERKNRLAAAKNHSAKTAEIIQLPLWPEPVRGTPNSFLRSALFAAIQGKTRRYMKGEFLAAQKGVTVSFTGMQFDQSDLDVWQQAADIAKAHPLGNVCHFRANAFLKAIGRRNGKKDYVWLHEAINRLIACAVEIRCGSKVFTGSLVYECIRDEETGIYKLTMSPALMKLFGAGEWTALEWKQREALKGKPLALWLHGYYATHADPFPIKVETLKELSGSANKDTRLFKRRLKEAFAELESVTGRQATFDGDLVTAESLPTPAQAKHLAAKARRRKKQP